jgi:quercetin dioxygenase-like cupin family protein
MSATGLASRVRYPDRCLKRKGVPVAANEKKKYLIGPDEGVHLPVLDITHKVTAEDFGGAFTITEAGLPPGEMITPHTHAREDECAFVLEGELTFDVGGEIVVAPAGSFVVKPRGVYHAFCNTGTGPNRHLKYIPPVSSRTTTTSMSRSSRAR